MTRIYLIRHAEAEGNLYRRAQGHYNANITPLGLAQIGALAERFRDTELDALWSSDLNRTRSTASAILKYHPELEIHTTPALREIDVGVWEDVAWGSIAREYPEQMSYFTHDPARWSVPGCEPYPALQARMKKAVLEIAAAYEGKTVAIVSHGLCIRGLLCGLMDVPSHRIGELPYGDNTSVSLLKAENGKLSVEYYNDGSHLGALSTFARQAWWRDEGREKQTADYTFYEPVDLKREGTLYSECYKNTWLASHGNLTGYSPGIYRRMAEQVAKRDPRCLMKISVGGRFAGIIQLDPERGVEDGAGWISLLYVEPEMRGRRLGVQLIGHAVSFFRRAGRRSIRLHVSCTNETALGFYRHNGFVPVKEVQGVGGTLYLMEMDITQRVFTLE